MNRRRFPTLWTYTAREMQRRPGRTLLTLLGIVIGVATIMATWVTVDATRRAYRDLFEQATGRASLEVVAQGYGGFDATLVAQIKAVPGVKAALPAIQTPAALVGPSGTIPVLVLGIDPVRDGIVRDYPLREGRQLGDADGILLEAGFAATHRCEVGTTAHLWTPTGLALLPVQGLMEPSSTATLNGGAVVVMPLGTAQRLFGLTNQVNTVHLVLDSDIDQERVESDLRACLPQDLVVQAPASRAGLAQDILLFAQQGFASLSVVSLVAGAFVILNSFLMNLGERRRQLAILRTLGATRIQVTYLLLGEALFLGVCGTALGIAVGMVLTLASVRIVATVLGVAPQDVHWTARPFLVAVLLGPGMSIAATFVPARRAGQRRPLEELVPRRRGPGRPLRRWPCLAGLGLLSAPMVLETGLRRGWFMSSSAPALMAGSTMLFLIGSALVLPLLLPGLLRAAGLILVPFFGVASRLAIRNLDRHRARTTLTVGVLMIAVVFAIAFGTALLNWIQGLHRWSTKFVSGSFYVRCSIPDLTTQVTGATLPESIGQELQTLEGVERVDSISAVPARAADFQVMVLAMTLSPQSRFPFELVEGNLSEAVHKLQQGEVVLGTRIASRLRLYAGMAIMLETRHGPRQLRVAGIARDYSAGGMVVVMDLAKAKQLFAMKGILCFVVSAPEEAGPALGGRLQAYCRERNLVLQSKAEMHDWFESKIAGAVVFCWVLLALAFVVSSLGVLNTLTMGLLEQTREIGVLRALGMNRGQVRSLVMCQALAIGVASLAAGLLLGITWSYWMPLPGDPLVGPPHATHLDLRLIGGCILAALGVPILASLFPSRNAAKLAVSGALRHE
jgi:putative ABC transport system permease protein